MRRKVSLGLIITLIAAPALWFGTSAYNDYRVRNCSPAASLDTPPA